LLLRNVCTDSAADGGGFSGTTTRAADQAVRHLLSHMFLPV
jgi:hypothetical protein